MEAWNAPLSAMRTLPSHVNQVTGPNGVLKAPVAFTVSPTTPAEVSGVPVADNVVVGANGVCASREAWKPPSEVGRTLPSTVNHFNGTERSVEGARCIHVRAGTGLRSHQTTTPDETERSGSPFHSRLSRTR